MSSKDPLEHRIEMLEAKVRALQEAQNDRTLTEIKQTNLDMRELAMSQKLRKIEDAIDKLLKKLEDADDS